MAETRRQGGCLDLGQKRWRNPRLCYMKVKITIAENLQLHPTFLNMLRASPLAFSPYARVD